MARSCDTKEPPPCTSVLILAESEKVLDEEESEAEVGQSDSDDDAPAQAPAIDMGVSGVLECPHPFL